jgi:hypothetical protein
MSDLVRDLPSKRPPFGPAAIHPRRWVSAQGPGADGGPRDTSRALDGIVPKMVAIQIATIQRITTRMMGAALVESSFHQV